MSTKKYLQPKSTVEGQQVPHRAFSPVRNDREKFGFGTFVLKMAGGVDSWAMRRMRSLLIAVMLLALPAAGQDWARATLEKSPRHAEWIQLKYGDRTVSAFVVYPEVKNKAAAVVVIHEIFGLSDWARSVADQLAANGYIAIAPDLLSGMGPKGGKTSDFANVDAVREAISKLDPDQVTADLNAAADYVKKLPAANGKLAVVGFCWGGGQSFRFATSRKDLSAAFVFYGAPPKDVSSISAPVYGFYAGNDERIDATIPDTREAMKKAGRKYDVVTYEGAGHGFMRAGEDPANTVEANAKARSEAWVRWLAVLKGM
jgi:carboxymethylenebutenolidase